MQGLGFPGSSSHRKGTEAEVWCGGDGRLEGFGDSFGEGDKMSSLGVELASDTITLCVCVFLSTWRRRSERSGENKIMFLTSCKL